MFHIRRLSTCATAALLTGILGATGVPGAAASPSSQGVAVPVVQPHLALDQSDNPPLPGVTLGGPARPLMGHVDVVPQA